MADRIDALTVRVHSVEGKLDELSTTVGELSSTVEQLSASVDKRFDDVDAAIVEQRQYTEFAYERLERRMDAGFAEIRADVGGVKVEVRAVAGGLGRLERKLDQFIEHLLPPSETPH